MIVPARNASDTISSRFVDTILAAFSWSKARSKGLRNCLCRLCTAPCPRFNSRTEGKRVSGRRLAALLQEPPTPHARLPAPAPAQPSTSRHSMRPQSLAMDLWTPIGPHSPPHSPPSPTDPHGPHSSRKATAPGASRLASDQGKGPSRGIWGRGRGGDGDHSL